MKIAKTYAAELSAALDARQEYQGYLRKLDPTIDKKLKDILEIAETEPSLKAVYHYAYGLCVSPISEPPAPKEVAAVNLFKALQPVFLKHGMRGEDFSYLDASVGFGDPARGAEIREAFLNASCYRLGAALDTASTRHRAGIEL